MSTHHQLLYHIVFSTKDRKPLLQDGMREETFAYMAGICKNLKAAALNINGFYDHAHLLVRIPATLAVADFVGRLKASTSKHINDTSGTLLKFGWQDGYGAFTVSSSQKQRVFDYIDRQMEHHKSEPFESEYVQLLDKHEVEYDPKYVWD